jgi:AcrR family transcriptional regulator
MPPAQRGPYAKSAEVKRAILEACVSAFGESGFHGVTMAEIARRAEISHTGLVHHFPDKQTILTALLVMQDERAARFLEEHSEREGGDPVEVIRGMLETIVGRRIGLVEVSVVLSAEAVATSHPAHEHFRQRYENIRRFLTRQFSALRDSGRLDARLSPDQLATVTVALVEGLQEQWLYAPAAIDVDALLVGALSAFIPELAGE